MRNETFDINQFKTDNPYQFNSGMPDFKVKGLLEGLVNVIITDERKQLVNMRELHEVLNINSRYNDWIQRRIEHAGFEEGKEFYSFLSKSQSGRPKTEYYFLLNAAKEAAMMENNEMGKMFRKYFIDMEQAAIRFLGKHTRLSLTDVIRDYWNPSDSYIFGKVTNELIYKPLFNQTAKQLCQHFNINGNLRDGLNKDDLEKIDEQESQIIKFIVDFGLKFEDIKKLMDRKRINKFYKSNFHLH